MAVVELSVLERIREKLEVGERLDFEDGLALLETDDLLALGELADLARRLRGGTDDVYFAQNLYVNQTNVCRVKCKFCAFAATSKQPHAYTFTPEELVEDVVGQRDVTGFTELNVSCSTTVVMASSSVRASEPNPTPGGALVPARSPGRDGWLRSRQPCPCPSIRSPRRTASGPRAGTPPTPWRP